MSRFIPFFHSSLQNLVSLSFAPSAHFSAPNLFFCHVFASRGAEAARETERDREAVKRRERDLAARFLCLSAVSPLSPDVS